ncbi:MAG: polysaccharide pyruvyl transferase family protein [Candidatus Cloacimonetes bacterium]|nr:polysaccharide pyruvyl transferase family protein [Candidatus Cloacimonadota bacterium]
MKKRILLSCLFIMVVFYAILEWKYSTKEISILVPYTEYIKLTQEEQQSIHSQEIYLAYSDTKQYNELLNLNFSTRRLIYWKNSSSNNGISKDAAGIFVSDYKDGYIDLNSSTVDHSRNFDIAFSAEIMNHLPLVPTEAYGIRLRWIHYLRSAEVENLKTDRIKQRLKRSLIERNIRAIFYNFSEKVPWKAFRSDVIKSYNISLAPRRVFFNWDRVRNLFTCLFLLILAIECKWILLVLLTLFLEYPTNIQVSGFLFVQISVFHLYYTYVKGLQNKKEVLLVLRFFPLWIKAILFAFTYYFLMDYHDFDQRFYLARGVKFSLLFLPACVLIYEIVKNFKNFKSFLEAKKAKYFQGFFIIIVLGLISYLVLIRSGNSPSLEPSQLELMVRQNLENVFLARPRFKELMGLFSLVLFYLGLKKNNYTLELFSKLMFCLYLTTFFNSFSHFHTSFWFVFLRELNTIVLGLTPLLVLAFIDLHFWRQRASTINLGYFGFNNFGDDLLKLTLMQESRDSNDKYIVKSYSTNSHHKKEILRRDYEQIFTSFSNTEIMSLGPGGVLQDRTSSLSLYYYSFYCVTARLLGCRVIWNHLGFSPLKKSLNKLIVFFLIKIVDEISVRDEDSFAYLESLGVSTTKLLLKSDLVYKYNISSAKIEKEDHLAIVLRAWKTAPLASWIQEISNTGYRRVYFIFQKDDALKKLIENHDPKAIIKEYSGEAQSFYRDFSRFKKVISMRFHGLILADIFNSDVLALNYDMKCQSFCEEKDIQSCLNEDEFQNTQLFSKRLKSFIQ